MQQFWWSLPGPGRFLSDVYNDLRTGRNVVLSLPEHYPGGLRDAVCSRVRESECYSFRTIHVEELEAASTSPARYLHDNFDPLPPGEIASAKSLAVAESFAGYLFWLDGLSVKSWQQWKPFLLDYEHACRSRGQHERTVFCAPLVGELTDGLPEERVALAVRHWKGIVDRIDMTLFVAELVRSRRLEAGLLQRVRIGVLTELAGTDAAIAQALADEPLEVVFDPREALKRLAASRGWPLDRPRWSAGTLDHFDGSTHIHSAALAAAGQDTELRRRIWKGQVAVLFPFIEERRQDLVSQLERYAATSRTQTSSAAQEDLMDLEIGQLFFRFYDVGLNPMHKQMLYFLKEMRNLLAHLQPVSAQLLASLDLGSPGESQTRSVASQARG